MTDPIDQLSATRRAPFSDKPDVGGRGRATQRAILEAATAAFDELGYHRTSVEAITTRVGCSRATFYQYFEGKEDLFRRLAGRFGREFGDSLETLGPIDASRAGRHLIRGWIMDLVEIYGRYRPIADNYQVVMRGNGHLARGSADFAGAYGRALERAIVGPVEGPAEVSTLAGMIPGLVYSACTYRERMGHVAPARFADALADVIHRTLYGAIDGVNVSSGPDRTIPPPTGWSAGPAEVAPLGRKGLRTRERLAAAAAKVLGRDGYEAARVSDITSEAGLSHGAFYRYFDDKASVFDELVRAAADELVRHLRELPDPPGGITAWAHQHMVAYGAYQGLFSVWPEATASGASDSHDVLLEATAVLADALADRPFGDVDADVVICLALLDRLPFTTYQLRAVTADEAAAGLALFLARGVLGRPL